MSGMAKNADFNWEDPLDLESQLSEQEKMSLIAYIQSLRPDWDKDPPERRQTPRLFYLKQTKLKSMPTYGAF